MGQRMRMINMIIYDPQRGEYVDDETGEVIEDRVAVFAERAYYDSEQYRERKQHGETLKHSIVDYGISTIVDTQDIRLVRQHMRTRNIYEYKLLRTLKYLHMIRGRLYTKYYIPSHVYENAALLIRKTLKDVIKLEKVKVRALVAAALYISMKQYNIYIDKEIRQDIKEYADIKFRDFFRAYRLLVDANGHKIYNNNNGFDPMLIIEKRIEKIKNAIDYVFSQHYDSCIASETMQLLEKLAEAFMNDISLTNKFVRSEATAGALINLAARKCLNFDEKLKKYHDYRREFTLEYLADMLNISSVSLRLYIKNINSLILRE
jgi:transcription initiation factor TFIIIB Brf1 subunit/transcription initiation factor TFIIB